MALSQIVTTIGSTTYTFTADKSDVNSLTLMEASSTLAIPRFIVLKRVFPRKTKSFPGVARISAKLTWNVADPAGVVTPLIAEFTHARRADIESVEVERARALLAAVVMESEVNGLFTNLVL